MMLPCDCGNTDALVNPRILLQIVAEPILTDAPLNRLSFAEGHSGHDERSTGISLATPFQNRRWCFAPRDSGSLVRE
jgi:hypothetical protein